MFGWMLSVLVALAPTATGTQTTERTSRAPSVRHAQVQWIKEHAVVLDMSRSANDFGDLAPLRGIVGDSRIVALGEASHGDGSTFAVKERMIRFLHQEMGFDVLVFESGLYSCHKAWQWIREGKDPVESVHQAIFPIWTDSAQARPLFQYLAQAARSDHPLELAGFDMQVTGKAARDFLLSDLQQFLQTHAPAPAQSEDWTTLKTLEKLFSDPRALQQADTQAQERLLAALRNLRRGLADVAPAGEDARQRGFWRQELENLGELMRFLWAFDPRDMAANRERKVFGIRERQMARNMLFLAEDYFAGRKIVLWGATSHLSRNRQEIETNSDPEMVPMGHALWERFGEQTFVIGFTAGGGQTGVALPGAMGTPHNVPPPSEESLEALLTEAGLDTAVVPLRNADARWLHDRWTARPMGHADMRADWTRVMDALVFIRAMQPSLRVAEDSGNE